MRLAALRSLALASALSAAAHPEIEMALARLNAQIAAAPADASLFLERGELYAQHFDWVAAEANFLLAAELAPHDPGVARARGALALATHHPEEARVHLTAALGLEPDDATSLVWRARAQAALNDRRAAVADFEAALTLVPAPPPELFLELVALLDAPEAIRRLDAAVAWIGPAITLHLRALSLEESLGRTDAALARLDRLAAQCERKETWLKRRGDLLRRAGRPREARAAYASALEALAALPAWLRESPECVQLGAELSQLTAPNS